MDAIYDFLNRDHNTPKFRFGRRSIGLYPSLDGLLRSYDGDRCELGGAVILDYSNL